MTSPAPTEETSSSPRLAIVLSHPTQYYSPWFAYLAQTQQVTLRVFYLWDFGVTQKQDPRFGQSFAWDLDLLAGYEHEFVPNIASDAGTHHFAGLNNPALVERIDHFAPDLVMLFGYRYRSHLRVIRAARGKGWKLIFRGDSHLLGHPPVSLLKRYTLRWIFNQFDCCLYVGKANRDYFRAFGIREDRLAFAPHSVDANRFSRRPAEADILSARQALGADEDTRIILFAGKLHPEKAPLQLLEAFVQLSVHNVMLVFAGSGELKETLEEEAKKRKLTHVRFLPFANQTEMPLRYAIADIFVLPSVGLYETWGLAVNEAMHCGVPCVVSDRVGCQQDLVTPNETGWVFPAGDVTKLSQTLEDALRTLGSRIDRDRLLQAIKERIGHYTYRQTSDGLMKAIRAILPPSS
jgi:glycosyltransferase involved in cell wall biosynthesis